ncbi:hypothetical protein H0A61_02173 [Koleobacter methoxysyntrophicus]|jgi:hypothetical protein|uniref:Uncharacterized protein n=1 Tax=Koleobacter methoxysyntrophicus TaxID=2751313 RepID=A0A8A0RPF7_9FIRM|nr:hypothetical protein [Koleobacter methoxysyntrophicus]QSQ09792.1 hypothetical protein H0A61_02173 [Koleobacter methoxysyntrophicus]
MPVSKRARLNEVEWEEVELAKNFPVDWVVEEEKRALEMYDGRCPNSFHIEPYIFDNDEICRGMLQDIIAAGSRNG